LLNLKEYHQRARLQGVSRKHNIAAQELTDPRTTLAERMTDAANLIYKLTGRESLEAISRARSFGTGVLNAQHQLPLALKGNKDAVDWMNKFGPKDWRERGVSDTLIDETAANWVRRHQGSYNYEDQPVWTMTGKASPFFAYSKWNIGRLNRFQADVIAPAFRGDIKPLAKSVLAAYVSGKALESMLVALTGRKQQWPTEEELKLDEARKSDYAYRFAALADLSGFGGMASSLVKNGFDIAIKTQPQGFNFQLYDTSANLVKRVSQAAQAMDDGENPIEVLAQLGEQLAKDNIQTYRLYLANFGDEDAKANIERGNRLRDLRVFKQMHDYPTSPLGSYGANPFEGQLERQFKRTSNPEEAASLLQEKLLPRYLAEAAENPEMLSRRLKALRRNSDQTFPSPAASPLQFQQYTDFLRRSGGETHMESELDRYLRQAALNRLKSAMVPAGF